MENEHLSLEEIERLGKLRKDLKEVATKLTEQEARYLVDEYYIMQESRKRSANQTLAMAATGEPNALVGWLSGLDKSVENSIKTILGLYAASKDTGAWCMSNFGVGPVISAGLLAHIDIKQAPTVGHIWSFAGLNPKRKFLGKEKAAKIVDEVMGKTRSVTNDHMVELSKRLDRRTELIEKAATQNGKVKLTRTNLKKGLAKRPFNGELKTLCWKIGQSFMKNSGQPKCYYGKLYLERKALEWQRNLDGEFASEADRALSEKNFKKNTTAYKFYSGQVTLEACEDYRAAIGAGKIVEPKTVEEGKGVVELMEQNGFTNVINGGSLADVSQLN